MSGFASTNDFADKAVSFDELGPGLYGYTAEGDPNSGVVIGDDSVLVDAQATPVMANEVIARIRQVTDKPIKHLVLSHYHAVRVLGASAYRASEIIASEATRELIVERGRQDMDSEIGRCPRLFRGKESIPGLTWPTLTVHQRATLWLGRREVQIIHIGRSHTAGIPSSGCRRSASASPAIASNTARRRIAATRISPTGRRRSPPFARSARKSSFPAEAVVSAAPPRSRRQLRTPPNSPRSCSAARRPGSRKAGR